MLRRIASRLVKGGGALALILLSIAAIPMAVVAGEKSNTLDSLVVWSQATGGNYQVLLAQKSAGQWLEPQVVSNNDSLNIVPCAIAGDNGEIWVVWTVASLGKTDLYFSRKVDGTWSEEQKIETGLDTNIAPSILLDNEQTLWLVWSGGDGQDDEIFFSRWNGTAFEAAGRISDNGVPDVLPVLGITSKGNVWVQWNMYGDQGYIAMAAEWDGNEWSEPEVLGDDSFSTQKAAEATNNFHLLTRQSGQDVAAYEVELENFTLPESVANPDTASLFLPEQEIQSLPLRLLKDKSALQE